FSLKLRNTKSLYEWWLNRLSPLHLVLLRKLWTFLDVVDYLKNDNTMVIVWLLLAVFYLVPLFSSPFNDDNLLIYHLFFLLVKFALSSCLCRLLYTYHISLPLLHWLLSALPFQRQYYLLF